MTDNESTEGGEALLVLADGTVFEGEAVGAAPPGGIATGEVVFNTVMTGYQEVLTDPSYAGQIVAFTCPHIGNYGATRDDSEAGRPACRGVVVRDLSPRPSSWRATEPLESFLVRQGIAGIAGVDTRRLTRHIREAGSMPAALGTAGEPALLTAARREPGTEGRDLVAEVTVTRPYTVPGGPLRVVAYDFGVKRSLLRELARFATLEVVPAGTPADEVLARRPDGVFLSNGPGDPTAVPYATAAVADLVGRVPVLGVCLGHQLLAVALGGRTYKLPFGHHGGNHPVRRLRDGRVQVTTHNHNYAVEEGSVPGGAVTHVNLNDGVVEGLSAAGGLALSVQYHPEAAPGPHDARPVFDRFLTMMTERGAA